MTKKEFAIRIARQAGTILKNGFFKGQEKNWKEDKSIVTKIDLEINRLVLEAVKREYPDCGVLSEEESFATDKKNLWVCDPVDGTLPFAHGIPVSTFSLAFVENGEPQLGIVYDPFTERLFYAEKGKGAFLNDKPIKVLKDQSINRKLVEIETWKNAPYHLWRLAEKIEEDGGLSIDVCSFAYSATSVAAGEMIGGICAGARAHDMAASKVIVEEAGGKVTDLFGQNQRYDQENIKGAIVSNGLVHEYLVEKVKEVITKNS